jgi:hypothetical protein
MVQDVYKLRAKLPVRIVDYLEEEFIELYEYLSNGESLEEFSLEAQQYMTILQEKREIQRLLEERLDIEFVERIELETLTIYRIGIRRSDDIQLYYCIGGIFGKEIEKSLRELEREC